MGHPSQLGDEHQPLDASAALEIALDDDPVGEKGDSVGAQP